jgi:hypothetical protein
LETIIHFLKQPYPFDSNIKKVIKRNALIGCFVAFFLIVFQPFGTANWHDEYKTVKLLGYGLVALVVPTLLHWIHIQLQKPEDIEENWQVGKEILLMLLIIIFITLGNMVYATSLGMGRYSINSFISFFFVVLVIAFFPIVAGVLLRYNHFRGLNQKAASELEQNLQDLQQQHEGENQQQVSLIAENEKDTINLIINDLLYIESADNYSNIVFWKNNKIEKVLLRGALKRFEQQLAHYSFIQRCHRSYIINLEQVEHISGNAQGYRMSLKNYDSIIIPVARNYGATILRQLKG